VDILENVISKVSKDIEILLSVDSVTFKRDSTITKAKPILYISKDTKPKVLCWGKEAPPNEEHLKINVFNHNATGEKISASIEECLVAFFSMGIREVVGWSSLVRPKIIVHNIDSLSRMASNVHKDLIEKVLMQCGARLCKFL